MSVVQAITNTHESCKDDQISLLQSQIEDLKCERGKQLNELSKKLDKIDSKCESDRLYCDSKIENIKIDNITQTQNSLTDAVDKISDKTTEMTDTLKNTCEAMFIYAKSNETKRDNENNNHVSHKNNTRSPRQPSSRLDNTCNIRQHTLENTYPIDTQNRFQPLLLDDDNISVNSDNYKPTCATKSLKQVAVVGNSHIRNLRTKY
ncbi:unnamed protein product [Mytilus coruscus]|uniref:Uncharacterized protein n=1 Tax=Mytilus coruscus TaxID=42192 RepID=A0A6J8CP40_MYTCO|nr:unnamed protein product [Mytilus coruscus]